MSHHVQARLHNSDPSAKTCTGRSGTRAGRTGRRRWPAAAAGEASARCRRRSPIATVGPTHLQVGADGRNRDVDDGRVHRHHRSAGQTARRKMMVLRRAVRPPTVVFTRPVQQLIVEVAPAPRLTRFNLNASPGCSVSRKCGSGVLVHAGVAQPTCPQVRHAQVRPAGPRRRRALRATL